MKKQEQLKSDYVRLNINLPQALKNDFLALAKNNDTDGSKLVRSWIKEYLKIT